MGPFRRVLVPSKRALLICQKNLGHYSTIMIIFKDVFSGDEFFSDAYNMTIQDDCLYKVVGKYETRAADGEVNIGGNASADGQDESAGVEEAGSTSGVNIILDMRLVQTGFGDKKQFTDWMKIFMKQVVEYLEKNDRSGEVADFKKNIAKVFKELLGKFKTLDFYTGESMDSKGLIVILDYPENDEGVEVPTILAFKHAMVGEKV